jgi:tRNA threonylcarbamoyladenosine biosynthesis protein TsaB
MRETPGILRPMRTLLFDTSTERGIVGLADGESIVHQRTLPSDRRHARDLVPAIKAACDALGWPIRSVKLFTVGAGPGSYTGLRVGLAAVKALALANGARIVALDSLEVVASQAGPAVRIVAVADAQQQRIYTAWFQRADGTPMTRRSPTALQSTEEWLASLQPGDRVTGPAVGRWIHRIPDWCRVVEPVDRLPNVAALLALTQRDVTAGRFAELHALEPIYLRPSAAEERRPA